LLFENPYYQSPKALPCAKGENGFRGYFETVQLYAGAGAGISAPVGCCQPAYCSGATIQHQLQAPSFGEE